MNEEFLPVAPLVEAASATAAASGFAMKDQWIGKVLNEVRRGNEVIEQQESNPLSVHA